MVEDVNVVSTEGQQDQDEFLTVKNLVTEFFTSKGTVHAIDDVSFSIKRGEIYGLVGESGSGKSVTASSILDIVPDPPGRIMSGNIIIGGIDILADLKDLAEIVSREKNKVKIKRRKRAIKKHNALMNNIRGRMVSIIFQEPGLALNPVLKLGDQLRETIMTHSIIEMGDAIVRRFDFKEEEVASGLENIRKISKSKELRAASRDLCRKYGVPEFSEIVYESIENGVKSDFLLREILDLIIEKNEKVDIDAIELVRDYYLSKQVSWNHRAESYRLSGEKDTDHDDTDNSLERFSGGGFFDLMQLRMKLFKSKYKRPFMDMAKARALEMLELVNIPEPERIFDSYPHELSGGMQQRVMVAIALATNPKLLIADEPTTALDVTTQAQILDLIKAMRQVIGSSILFITHDLAVIAEMCDRVGVMYAGNIVEEAPVKGVFHNPKHPYTIGLLKSIPKNVSSENRPGKLEAIPGSIPNLIRPPPGCRFHTRCQFAMEICREKKPKLEEVEKNHKVACFLFSEESVN